MFGLSSHDGVCVERVVFFQSSALVADIQNIKDHIRSVLGVSITCDIAVHEISFIQICVHSSKWCSAWHSTTSTLSILSIPLLVISLVKFPGVVSYLEGAIKIITLISVWIYLNKTVPALGHNGLMRFDVPTLGRFCSKIFVLRFNYFLDCPSSQPH